MEKKTLFLPELAEDTGRVGFSLTNDYMFRAMCQHNNRALRGLISSLLHIPVADIYSAVIMNPIILGEACSDKEFRMDVRVELNGHMVINIEMQIRSQQDWPERSTSYLCRMFDNLSRGKDYDDVMPAVHIGILDFTLFPENPAFYSCNKLMDEKTHHIYSDKFALNVLDLNKVEMATDEDIEWGLDKWARLFKADTWEVIKMVATGNEYLMEASNTLYALHSNFDVMDRARNRAEYYRSIRHIEEMTKVLEVRSKEIDARGKEIDARDREIDAKSREVDAKSKEIDARGREIDARDKEIDAKSREVDAKSREIDAKIQRNISKLIDAYRKAGSSEEEIKQLIMEDFELTPDKAEEYLRSV